MLNCGDATAAEIDQEVMRILKEAYDEAKRLLSENRDAMDQIAEFLIDKETITGKEFMQIFRRVKGIPEPEEKAETEGLPDTNHFEKGGEKEAPKAEQSGEQPESQPVQEPQVSSDDGWMKAGQEQKEEGSSWHMGGRDENSSQQ